MANVGRMVKESMVQELSARLAGRSSLFVTRVNRLTASDADSLRRKLSASKADVLMVKRRLGKRVLAGLQLPGLDELLEGSIALVLPDEEALSVAKLLVEFVKTHEEQLFVSGAVIDGQLFDTTRVKELAGLPPKPVLLAQVVATIESPLTDVICTLERLVGDVAWIVEQIAEQQPAPTAPTTEAGTTAAGEGTQPSEQQHPKPEEGTPS